MISGSLMKRKYRSGLYLAKHGKGIKRREKMTLLQADLKTTELAVVESTPTLTKVEGIDKVKQQTRGIFKRSYVAKPDVSPFSMDNHVYWPEESTEDSTLNNRTLEIILGVLCSLVAIAAFVGLIFGVVELAKIAGGTSSSSLSAGAALTILAFGLPLAIAVVWTLVALAVKLFRGE